MGAIGGLAKISRKFRSLLLGATVLLMAGLFYLGLDSPPPVGEPERLEGRIIGFEGRLSLYVSMENEVVGRVRLADGSIRRVRWPEQGASHCRVGDTVRLARLGNRIRVVPPGCGSA
jgi:hypothetical protein